MVLITRESRKEIVFRALTIRITVLGINARRRSRGAVRMGSDKINGFMVTFRNSDNIT